MFKLFRTHPAADPTRPKRKWRRRLFIAGFLLLTLVYFLPTIVAKTGVLDRIVANASKKLKGSIRVGGASLGWFSAVELRDVELRDEKGDTVATISSIRGSKSLLGLLRNSRDLGEFHLDGAEIRLVAEGQGTNLEAILAPAMQPEQAVPLKPSSPSRLYLTGEKIRVHVSEPSKNREWSVELADLSIRLNASVDEKMAVNLRGIVADTTRSGELKLELKSTPSNTAGTVMAKALPLGVVEPFLKRLDPSTVIDGTLDADLEFVAGTNGDSSVSGTVRGRDLVLSGGAIRDDLLSLQLLDLPCRVRTSSGKVFFDQLALRTDVGTIDIKGSLPLEGDMTKCDDLRFGLDLDLAGLADRLPKTVKLQTGTQLKSGRLNASLKSARENGAVVWKGDLKTSNLRGTSQGKEVIWDQPLSVEFAVRPQEAGLPRIDKLRCESDFVRLNATSTPDSVTMDGRCDLDRFRERVSRWIDLGAFDVSGEANLRLTANRRDADGFQVKGEATFQHVRDRQTEQVRVELNVAGAAPANGPLSVSGGGVTVQAAGDGLGLYVVEPIPDLAKLERGGLRLILRGDLDRWQARLRPFLSPLKEFQTAGPVDLTILTKLDVDSVKLLDLDAKFGDAAPGRGTRFVGYGIDLQEPTLKLKSSGMLRRSSGKLTLEATNLDSPSLQLQLASAEGGSNLKGEFQLKTNGTVSGDLARLQKWFRPSPIPPQELLKGNVSGKVELVLGSVIKIDADLKAENAVLGDPKKPAWKDSKLTLAGRVELDPAADTIRFAGVRLDGTGVGCTADGKISNLATTQDVSLKGDLRYDFEKLEPELRGLLGQKLVVRGNETRSFKLEGSMANDLVKLKGDAALSWRELNCFGADVGSTEIAVSMQKGWLVVPPIDTSLNGGKLKLVAGARLDPGPSELVVYQGTTIERAVITPKMCNDALGFLAPVLAKTADAEGTFSMVIDTGRVPLNRPEAGDITGRITLHTVRLGAGPLLRELSVVSNNPNTIALAKDQVVPFRMVNGRVYHEGLRLSFPELTVTTSGSVGMDGSLDLVAEMPIPPKWLGKTVLTSSVAKQTIRLPIGGTLSQPKVNEQALRSYLAQFAKDATKDILKDEIERKFQKLIKP